LPASSGEAVLKPDVILNTPKAGESLPLSKVEGDPTPDGGISCTLPTPPAPKKILALTCRLLPAVCDLTSREGKCVDVFCTQKKGDTVQLTSLLRTAAAAAITSVVDAVYSGDLNFAPGTSNKVKEVVEK
jgi:hypothetical protein